jgi:hypothetical protein
MTAKSAHVTDVSIGNLTVEGLMYEDGTFAIAIPQISKLFPESVTPHNATRTVKRSLGKGSSEISLLRATTRLNSKAVNTITLDMFEILVFELAMAGDVLAQNFMRILFGLSLKQIWSDAFKVKFEAEDRQAEITSRQTGKDIFKRLMLVVQTHLHSQGKNDPGHYYAQLVNKIYRGLFGMEAKELRDVRSVDKSALTRDHFTARELSVISRVEDGVMFMIQHMGKEPFEAVDLCIQSTGTYRTLAINPEQVLDK